MQAYINLFLSDNYARISPLYNIITVFDSTLYSRNDYEVLSPPQRKYIIQKLQAFDHKLVSGNMLKNIKTGQAVRFVPNTKLGINPLDSLERHYNHDDLFIVSPGTYFLFLMKKLHKYEDSSILDEIVHLIKSHPVNLQQLLDLSKHEPYFSNFQANFNEFERIQKNAIEDGLKDKKPLGHIF